MGSLISRAGGAHLLVTGTSRKAHSGGDDRNGGACACPHRPGAWAARWDSGRRQEDTAAGSQPTLLDVAPLANEVLFSPHRLVVWAVDTASQTSPRCRTTTKAWRGGLSPGWAAGAHMPDRDEDPFATDSASSMSDDEPGGAVWDPWAVGPRDRATDLQRLLVPQGCPQGL